MNSYVGTFNVMEVTVLWLWSLYIFIEFNGYYVPCNKIKQCLQFLSAAGLLLELLVRTRYSMSDLGISYRKRKTFNLHEFPTFTRLLSTVWQLLVGKKQGLPPRCWCMKCFAEISPSGAQPVWGDLSHCRSCNVLIAQRIVFWCFFVAFKSITISVAIIL